MEWLRKLITKDDFDYSVPLLISFSGWLVLIIFLYQNYIQNHQDVFALITQAGEDFGSAQHTTLMFLAPVISGIFGYTVNRRLVLYKTKYLNESYVKKLAEAELVDLVNGLIVSFVNALDAKSTWTKGHSVRVRHYGSLIARELGVTIDEMNLLGISALLHDIGKIGTYDDILNKTDPLTEAEFELIKKHPDNAVRILSPIKELKDVLPIVKGHHERVDGSGYPDGLTGNAIPFLARILCVADAYDAITSERPYKHQMNRVEGLHEIQKNSGTQFDPAVVTALVSAHRRSDFDFVE